MEKWASIVSNVTFRVVTDITEPWFRVMQDRKIACCRLQRKQPRNLQLVQIYIWTLNTRKSACWWIFLMWGIFSTEAAFGNLPQQDERGDQEPGPSAGSAGVAEQTTVRMPTSSPRQGTAVCSTTLLLQGATTWKQFIEAVLHNS